MSAARGKRPSAPFEVKAVDREFYRRRLDPFLPEEIIDIHTHLSLRSLSASADERGARTVTWPSLVADQNPVEDLLETYRLMLPGRKVTPLVFSTLPVAGRLDEINAYVAGAARAHRLPALLFAIPEWSGPELEERLAAGGFLGVKVYLTQAPGYLPAGEIRIFDFVPPGQLEALDRGGRVLMLHLPRPGRLRDPVNLAQLLEIERSFPRLRVVVAHVGRAYCPEDVGDAFEVLADTRRLRFDISANTCERVFRRLLEAVGPKRVLFGSDLPVVRMRMRRVCESGVYVNLVPRGLYGDVSGDRHMREVAGPEAARLTFFLYEEIDAFRRAAEKAGLGAADIRAVFHDNAHELLYGPGEPGARPQLRMGFPRGRLSGLARPPCPPGYRLRTWQAGDDPAWRALMRRAGFAGWDAVAPVLERALPGGIFFVVDGASGRLVATACALHRPKPDHPFGAELGWVAADPAHRGRGLGRVACAAALGRLAGAGYRNIYLSTDDERLPAIKIYLDLGFRPRYGGPADAARWRRVRAEIARFRPERGRR